MSAGRRWIRGHASRGEGGYTGPEAAAEPLPGPDDPVWDAGIIDPDGTAPLDPGGADAAGPGGPAAGHGQPPAAGLPPRPDDVPPAHSTRDWRARGRAAKPAPARRVTAAIRGDIDAKLNLMLEVPARVWQARDPVCGGVFVAQRPAIASSLADIVVRSPQLVEWFTGTGGGFLLYLDALASMWPVATVVMAHHVYHSVEAAPEDGDGGQEPRDMSRFAA